MSLYAFPVVGRAGLGNMLFPWARAKVFARRSGARMLKPRWNTIRIGPYLRGEPEKRTYLGFFDSVDEISGAGSLMPLLFGKRVSEDEAERAIGGRDSFGSKVVVFNGLGDYFQPFLHDYEHVREQLWTMTAEPFRDTGTTYGRPFIAMHIRRGDLTRGNRSEEELERSSIGFTPTRWFVGMVNAVRRCPELSSTPIIIATDGSAEEVRPILQLENVHLHPRGTAIADIWLLAHADLLFASGYSTFSMWASYLGGMPTIYAPGRIQQKVQGGRPAPAEFELAGEEDIPPEVRGRLSVNK